MSCPRREIYTPGVRPVVWTAGVVATVLVACSAWLAISAIGDHQRGPPNWAIAIWAVFPPLWFWTEYFFLYKRYGNPDTFDLFKYGQQLSGAIWAALLALLTILANTDHFWTSSQ